MRLPSRLRVFSTARNAIFPRILWGGLVFAAAMLMVWQVAAPDRAHQFRQKILVAFSPVLTVASDLSQNVTQILFHAGSFTSLKAENHELKERLLNFQALQMDNIKLLEENQALRKQLHVIDDLPMQFISARIISDSSSGFSRNVVINAGKEDGVKKGQVVMADMALVGRVISVEDNIAEVLLLQDFSSRIPVVLANSGEHGILSGDGGNLLQLRFLSQHQLSQSGETVLTSGKGGGIPPGLLVGYVQSADADSVGVVPASDIGRLRFVQVVDYGYSPLILKEQPMKSTQTP